jgi:hypothetical protein
MLPGVKGTARYVGDRQVHVCTVDGRLRSGVLRVCWTPVERPAPGDAQATTSRQAMLRGLKNETEVSHLTCNDLPFVLARDNTQPGGPLSRTPFRSMPQSRAAWFTRPQQAFHRRSIVFWDQCDPPNHWKMTPSIPLSRR